MLGAEIRFPLNRKRRVFNPPLSVDDGRWFAARDPRHPFQGPGVSTTIRGITRAKRECESRFPLSTRRAFFLWMKIGRFVARDPRRSSQGPGVSTTIRGTTRAKRECESRFPLPAIKMDSGKCSCWIPRHAGNDRNGIKKGKGLKQKTRQRQKQG